MLSKDEAKCLSEKGCDKVVIGSGHMGNVHLSPEAEAYFERKGCEVVLKSTSEAIRMFNRSRAKRNGTFSRDLLKAMLGEAVRLWSPSEQLSVVHSRP